MTPKVFIAEHTVAVDYNNGTTTPMIAINNAKKACELAEYELANELLAADDIYQMSMNQNMVEEAKTKAINALSQLCISELLFEKQDKQELVGEVEPKFKVGDIVDNKPAWSDEDERLCQCLIQDQEKALDEVRNDKYGHSEIISDLKEMYRERIDWLKSLKQRLQLQGKEPE